MAGRLANPYQARTDLGAGLQNLMTALYATKGSSPAAGAAAHRSAAQDLKDTADAGKATAEANQINRVEKGIGDYVPNFAKSLVPENEVPNVMERSKTGIWPSFEDPRRQQSVVEGVGPVDWTPAKDASLNDAKQISAALLASKEANFKDLNSAQAAPANKRQFRSDAIRLMPELGGSEDMPAAAVVPSEVPTLGLPSKPQSGFLTAGGPPSVPADQPIVKPMATTPIDMERPIINNPDGSFSTERTITVEADGKHFVIPTIVKGQQLTPDQAIDAWRNGQNNEVGVFNSPQEAEQAAVARSAEIGNVRGQEAGVRPPPAPAAATTAPQHNIPPGPDLVAPEVETHAKSGLDTDKLRKIAFLHADDHETANAITNIANSAKGQQEADFKEREKNQWKPYPSVPGSFYNDKGMVRDANGVREMSGDEMRRIALNDKRAGATQIDASSYDKTGGAERAKASQSKQDNAYKAQDFAGLVKGLTTALEGYGGGPMTEFQAKIGRWAPESEYGKIASIEDLVNSVRTKLATTVRATGSGATSDFEMKSYLASIPGLANTPDGRKLMAEIAQRIADREMASADIYQELAAKGPVKGMEWRNRVRAEVGDLLTTDEMQKMNDMAHGVNVGGANTSAVPAAPKFSTQQLQDEARKRGLTK